jgi:uncharacterized membrane protein YkoI
MRKSTFSTAVASALALAMPIAFAAGPAGAPGQAKDAVVEHVARTDLLAFQNAKVPLPQAIAAGIQHVGGGKGMDVSFEAKGGTPAYRTKVYHNNTVWEGLVDANTGKVIGQGTTTPEAQLDQEDKAELAALTDAKTTLADAVKAAEQQVGGKAIIAGIEQRGGKVEYEIQVVRGGNIQQMVVDPATGRAPTG